MSADKIRLNKAQLHFVVQMTEIEDVKEAVKKFAQIMMEEKMHPGEMAKVIDIIMQRMTKK